MNSSPVIPKKIATHPQSTPQAIPRSPIMKGIMAYSLLVKVARGVFQRCVETTLDYFHQKLNGTLPTDPQVNCDRAIGYSGCWSFIRVFQKKTWLVDGFNPFEKY